MSKRGRQYIGILAAVILYYIVHEGAHLLYALFTGSFKGIVFMGLGVQIDIHSELLTDTQLGIFCLAGSVASVVCAYIMVAFLGRICQAGSDLFKACAYYVTLALLLIDPVYLSLLCGFFGGGDMNGISLLIPELAARIGYGVLGIVNIIVILKVVLPKYKKAFGKEL